jgi:hypothetical protein
VPFVTGKTKGSNNNDYLRLDLLFPATTTFTFDVSKIQLEEGAVASDFEQRPLGIEITLCQRYYETGFTQVGAYAPAIGMNCLFFSAYFNTYKRIPPTLNATTSYNVGCNMSYTSIRYPGFTSFCGYINSSIAGATEWDFTWTADAEYY